MDTIHDLGHVVRTHGQDATCTYCYMPASAVSAEQLEALEVEAGAHGDIEQVELCRLALAGDEAARALCERVIRDAQGAATCGDVIVGRARRLCAYCSEAWAQEHGPQPDGCGRSL